ncbi:portal protein [Planktomarina sp.]|uniref:portal protein n=1 Tax=Planktomarina sp. TaxID=2024851 RepID=UPI0032616718
MNIIKSAEKCKQDFELDYNATAEQREKANEEIRFAVVAGGQWEGYLADEYENRAKLEVDMCSEHLWRTYADWTDNRMGVNYSPDDDATTDEDAELLDGLLRRDMRRRSGQDSIDTAVMEAIAGGYGAVILNTEYVDEDDPNNLHQNIAISEAPNAYSMVVFDSGARRKDKSDARRCTVLTPYTKEVFEETWPDANLSTLKPVDQGQSRGRGQFSWHTNQIVYVGTRYEIEKKRTLVATYYSVRDAEMVHLHGKEEIEQEEPMLLASGYVKTRERYIKQRQVIKTVFTGDEILEKPARIAGKYIPVIPFYGYRGFVDGVEYFHGVIRKRMDSQRLLNMSISLAAEGAAHSHEGKPIFTPEQVSGLKGAWAENMHQSAYALADPVYNEDGTIQHLGPVGQIPGSTLAPAAASLIQMTSEFIRMGTGGSPQDIADPNASGKAINAIIKRVDKNTQPIFDNIRGSLKHLGNVYQSMAAEVYGGKENFGRIVQLVNNKDATTPVKLLTPRPEGSSVKYLNNAAEGSFEAIVDVSKEYSTQREEGVEALKDVLTVMPPEHPLFNDTLGEVIQLLPHQGLGALQKKIRKQQLAEGAEPESEEEEKIVEQLSQVQGQKSPNDLLMEAAAMEQQTQAAMNEQKIEGMKYENLKKLEESKKVQVETALLQVELKKETANGQANTLAAR